MTDISPTNAPIECQNYINLEPAEVTNDILTKSQWQCRYNKILYSNWIFDLIKEGRIDLEFHKNHLDILFNIVDFDNIERNTLQNFQKLKIKGGNNIIHYATGSEKITAENLKLLITSKNINEQNDIGNSPLFHICKDYYEISMHISSQINIYRDKTYNEGFSTEIATITTNSELNTYINDHYSTYERKDQLLYLSQQKKLLDEAGYAVSHPNINNLLSSPDITTKDKPSTSTGIDILDHMNIFEYLFNDFVNLHSNDEKDQKNYKIKMSKVNAQEERNNEGGYYASASKFSTSHKVPITNQYCSTDKLQILFIHGANPHITNEITITAKDIISIYCPDIYPTYSNLFEKPAIAGGDTIEHPEL